MSTYLLAFVVCDFDFVESKTEDDVQVQNLFNCAQAYIPERGLAPLNNFAWEVPKSKCRYLYTWSKNDVISSVWKQYCALERGLKLELGLGLVLGLELELGLG